MKYYLVEFVDDSVHSQYEEVAAISAEEAVRSIKLGWPEARIWNVWTELGNDDEWRNSV
jgi:hypothetical protein